MGRLRRRHPPADALWPAGGRGDLLPTRLPPYQCRERPGPPPGRPPPSPPHPPPPPPHIGGGGGLPRGVAAIAHRAAIQAGGRTVAVFACGLDIVYPPEHARLAREIMEHGALISDYPLCTQPRGDYFPRRNRIMSGVSLGVLVVEGDV